MVPALENSKPYIGAQTTLTGEKLWNHLPQIQVSEKKPTYPRDWHMYNEAQRQEKLRFMDLMSDICSFVPKSPRGLRGRPMKDFGEMIFCLALKQYENTASRRLDADMVFARSLGYIGFVPAPTTIMKYMNKPVATPILMDLIRLSSLPFIEFEDVFAVDSSGLNRALYSRWFDERFREKRYKDWLKIHLMVGVKSCIVTHIIVTDGNANDAPHLPKLVVETARNFRIKEVLADAGYLSRSNCDVITAVGAVPYIDFKQNSVGKSKGSHAFRDMWLRSQLYREEYSKHYSMRVKVETTFSTLKRRFSGRLLFKTDVAQLNEALCRILTHNIVVLSKEYYNSTEIPKFKEVAHLIPGLNINKSK